MQEKADVLIGLSFGRRKATPGNSNKRLAAVIAAIQEKMKSVGHAPLPMILQKEVDDAYRQHGDYWITGLRSFSIYRNEKDKDGYLDSYEVLRQAWIIMKKEGWEKAVIVAHPDHWLRCAAIAKWFGMEVVSNSALRVQLSTVGYDPQSVQFWTRKRWLFKIWTLAGWIKFWLSRKREDRQ